MSGVKREMFEEKHLTVPKLGAKDAVSGTQDVAEVKEVIWRRGEEYFRKLKESNDGNDSDAKINLKVFTDLVSASDDQYKSMLAALDVRSERGGTAVGVVRNSYLEFRARNIARHQGRLLSLDLVEKDVADQTVRDAWNLSGSVGEVNTNNVATFADCSETFASSVLGMLEQQMEDDEEIPINEWKNNGTARKGGKTMGLDLKKHGRKGNDYNFNDCF